LVRNIVTSSAYALVTRGSGHCPGTGSPYITNLPWHIFRRGSMVIVIVVQIKGPLVSSLCHIERGPAMYL
jgi:hypothetical protein